MKFASLDLDVDGMTCMGCENKVKAVLGSLDGVVETKKVCSESDKAVLTYDPEVITEEEIIEALVAKTGYKIVVAKNAGMTDESDASETSEASAKKSCSKEAAKACSKEAAKSCTKAEKAACAKAKASADKELEEAE